MKIMVIVPRDTYVRTRRTLYGALAATAIALAVVAEPPWLTRVGVAQGGLVAAYPLNEASGTTVTDVSGNANTGTISGATWTTVAKFGGALSFDGINDLVTVPDAPSLDLTTAYTLEAWVRPTTTSGWRTVLLKEAAGELAYALYANDNTARPGAWFRSPGATVSISAIGTAVLASNAWSHVAATYDGAALRLYVNGVLVRTRTAAGGAQATAGALRIGGNAVWGEYFRGQLDELRLYARALTLAEIQADMNTPLLGTSDTEPPTVAITSPAPGATVTQTITVTASAADNRAVTGVQFLLDGANLGAEDVTAPYSVSWNTTGATNTTHALSARARDAAGNTTVAPAVDVVVANPPRLVITQPAAGAAISGSTVEVRYTTTGDLTGVHHVHFVLDGGSEVMDMSFDGQYQLGPVPPASHTLTGFLVRSDHSKIPGTDAVPVAFTTTVPDTTAPSVAISSPAPSASLQGAVTLRASASDDVGVAGVQFLLDGIAIGLEDSVAPYEIVWDTTAAENGAHAVAARARDAAGNVATAAFVDVTVANSGGPSTAGEWSAPIALPVVAIHQALLPTGKVLMWDAGDFTSAPPYLWDPATGALTPAAQNATDLFCAGHVMLADGRLLTLGGDTRTTGLGVVDVNRFDPFTSQWTVMPPMSYKRWYPTGVTLSDGRVLVMSGYAECYAPSCLVGPLEMFDPRSNAWSTLPASADYVVPSYPFLFTLPDNRVLLAGSYEGTIDTRILNLATSTWSVVDPIRIDAGSAVMYGPGKFMKAGKWANSDPPFVAAHANTYVLDLSQAQPAWRSTAPMHTPRSYPMLTLLPDGTTLATGGSRSTDPASIEEAVLEAEIWSPDSETWTAGARMRNGRLYHGSTMLLPDGRVLVAGSGRYGSPEQLNGEIYSPPYLFKGPRPAITSAPAVVEPGTSFTVGTGSTDIAAVTLLRTGTMTHSFNSDQRFLKLAFTPGPNGLVVDAPANHGVAPPGYYLLFLVNSNGVPSVGSFVRIPSPAEDSEPPAAPSGLLGTGGPGSATLSWLASTDNTGVVGYDIHRGTAPGFAADASNRVGQTALLTFTNSGLAAGTYYYRVAAYDMTGNRSAPSLDVPVVVTADTQPPAVAVTSPAAGSTISGTVALTASASDDVAVAGVTFRVDGAVVGVEDTTAPYSIQWSSTGVANGIHQVSAVARDESGNQAVSAAVGVTVNNAVAPTGLVMALSFNEAAGGIAGDSSGSNNPGTIANAAWTAGRFGGGLQFNGTSAMVTVADAASLDLTNNMTVSAWVNPTSLADWRTVVLKERTAGLSYSLYAADGASRPPSGYINSGGGDIGVAAPSLLPLNTWTHLAMTFDGAALRVYVNGTLAATRAGSGSAQVSTGALRIGGNAVWGEYFAGVIDEVRIYNRALSQGEIQAHMNTPVQ